MKQNYVDLTIMAYFLDISLSNQEFHEYREDIPELKLPWRTRIFNVLEKTSKQIVSSFWPQPRPL